MPSAVKPKKPSHKPNPKDFGSKEAVMAAMDYFRELFPEAAKAGMSLEEIEASKDTNHWLITLGYDTKAERRLAFEVGSVRAYKLLTIDRTGKVLSVKIRSVA